ncbi:hypothetical protein KI387_039688, partial [Taxus chinensis]
LLHPKLDALYYSILIHTFLSVRVSFLGNSYQALFAEFAVDFVIEGVLTIVAKTIAALNLIGQEELACARREEAKSDAESAFGELGLTKDTTL